MNLETDMLNYLNLPEPEGLKTLKMKTYEFDTKTKQDQCCYAIKQIWEFLENYIDLANTHGAEFISEQHWNKFIPLTAQDSVLNLKYDDLVKLPLYHHNDNDAIDVDLTEQHANYYHEVSELRTEESHTVGHDVESKSKREKNCDTQTKRSDNNQWLRSFTTHAYQRHLENLNILTSLAEAVRNVDYHNKTHFKSPDVVSEAMSEKKIHEVGIMSEAVVATFKACQADIIVDIGSGKGYLGAEVSRKHVISVLGLDSSETNTHGAIRRDAQLGKRWKGLMKRKDKYSSKSKEPGCCDSKQSTRECSEQLTIRKVDGVNGPLRMNEHDSPKEASPNLYVPVTKFVCPEMNLRQVIQQHASHLSDGNDAKLLLTGLHTCGSLAVTILRLFLQDTGAVGLCYVGCCYQLMEELEKSNTEESSDDLVNCHFPLSHYGKQLDLRLGRNARNLASQSVHRIQASGQLQGGDFYWRALLDVIIKKLGLPVTEKIKGMRGLNKKCKTFKEYAEAAFKKLDLSPDLINRDELSEIEELHKDTKAQMVAFFQLKLVLAPLIEGLILLDRLLFLLEQEGVQSADLVPLFDPVTSPRCYALISVKSQSSKSKIFL